ncbi:F-box domain-containing protein [Mycena indigotica]|uniref:F-box domain-containing protein n=1 Tax=Mycena indigotica TaxID=2126181 RepID=A0A8H6T7W6_9AGAR|nr:F-box domain-containing protein [Mycena indigotica]KAF7312561.1 F-box domain-containing protein [Mycena indigotica]
MASRLLLTHYFRPRGSQPLPQTTQADIQSLLDTLPAVSSSSLDVIYSNSPLPGPEEECLCLQLHTLEAHVLPIEREMARSRLAVPLLETTLDQWKTLYSKLQNEVEARRRLFSPIRWIPDELLCEVFAQCVNEDEKKADFSFSLTRVIRVCRRWRNAALSCPSLWRRVDDDCHYLRKGDTERNMLCLLSVPESIQRAMFHLTHSGTHLPLFVGCSRSFDNSGIALLPPEDPKDIPRGAAFLDAILKTSTRWATLSLRFLTVEETHAFINKVLQKQISFPNLTRVTILTRYHITGSVSLDCVPLLSRMPALKHLTLIDNTPLKSGLDIHSAPWSRLQSCKLDWRWGAQAFHVFTSFPPNSRVVVRFAKHKTQLPYAAIKVALGELVLDMCQLQFISNILWALVAPNLHTLELWGRYGPLRQTTITILDVARLTQRSSCYITEKTRTNLTSIGHVGLSACLPRIRRWRRRSRAPRYFGTQPCAPTAANPDCPRQLSCPPA